MGALSIALDGLYSGLFALGLGVLLTAPRSYLPTVFLCGAIGRWSRDAFIAWGMSPAWATVVAATLVVLVAGASTRRQFVSPVVLVSGVLPLGAAVAMFRMIIELMRIPSLEGRALAATTMALSANAGKAFTTTLAIALGLAAGLAIFGLFRRMGETEAG